MRLHRLAVASLLLATVVAAPARAQSPPPLEPPRVPEGVTVSGVPVGGLTEDEVRAAVQAAFDRPLRFRFRTRTWRISPYGLKASPYVDGAVRRALAAQPGEALRLGVAIDGAAIRRYVAHLDSVFSRAPLNSRLLLRRLRPYLTPSRPGIDVRQVDMRNAIARALYRTDRRPIRLRVDVLAASVTRSSYGPIVVIRRESRRLYLYRNTSFVRRFAIAVGMPAYPTPLGRFQVVTRERHPTWDPPNSPWAAGLGPVPPGPENPLGTRWIGTSAPGIGIHGTPQPWTVGTAASHGCIRMYMREVEWLFERVRIGTPVFIVRA